MVAGLNLELSNYISLLEVGREREAITSMFFISRLSNQLMQHIILKLVRGIPAELASTGTVVGLSVNLACLLSISEGPALLNTYQYSQPGCGVVPHDAAPWAQGAQLSNGED